MELEFIASKNEKQLQQNNYPGRGIITGMTPDGNNYIQIYWIMGRSVNSRNRIFEVENNSVKTKAFDKDKMEDPSLIIYYPIKSLDDYHIISNGDHTNTIFEYYKSGRTFEEALNTREFEPDYPNYTPRISGFIDLSTQKASYGLSILKSLNNNNEFCIRSYFFYSNFIKGFGHCIHTYKNDGNPILSFDGEPFIVKLYDNIEKNAEYFWNLLNKENRVSLLVKYINNTDKNTVLKIVNKLL